MMNDDDNFSRGGKKSREQVIAGARSGAIAIMITHRGALPRKKAAERLLRYDGQSDWRHVFVTA